MSRLQLFLADADDGHAALEDGLPLASLLEAQEAATPLAFPAPDQDPNSLYHQGWGVIATDDDAGRALVARAQPLIDKRSQDQDMPARVMWAPPGLTGAEARAWAAQTLDDPSLDPMDIPGYLLMLGGPEALSVDLQRVLAEDAQVGRLAFDDPDGYDAYVAKLLRWERAPSALERASATVFTARDGSRATELGYESLIQPTVADLERHLRELDLDDRRHPFPAANLTALATEGPSSPSLLIDAAKQGGPQLLFSLSHGAGAPRRGWASGDAQRAEQGALCLGGGEKLLGEHVASGAFLPGGVWVMFACYGAGTPSESAFYRWLLRLKEQGGFDGRASAVLRGLPQPGDRPFIAALPQAALANPEGPLAVLGHLDLAWSYSFQELGERTVDRFKRWRPVLGSLVAGSRAGLALKELLRPAVSIDQETADLVDALEAARVKAQEDGGPAPSGDEGRLRDGNRWMTRQDLTGYVLLGDPAAYLPVRGARARAADAKTLGDPGLPEVSGLSQQAVSAQQAALSQQPSTPLTQSTSVLQQTPTPPTEAPVGPPAEAPSPAPEAMEAAVLDALLAERVAGPEALHAVAKKHAVAASDLEAWVARWRAAGRAALSGAR